MISLSEITPTNLPGFSSFGPATTTNRCTRLILIKEKMALSESFGEQMTTPEKSSDRCLSA